MQEASNQPTPFPEAKDPLYAVPDESLDRVERVIAISRVVLSISALVIILLDPREPVYSSEAVYFVLSAYIAYSLHLLWLFSYRGLRSRATSKPILLADVTWFTVIVALSEGGTSPFFLFYLFAVCTAAIRWGIRTTVRVSLLSAALYLGSIILVRRLALGPDFFLHTTHLMRPVYLVLLGYLVGFIGEHELSAKRRMIELVSMQREIGRSRSRGLTLARLVRRIVRFFGTDYLLLQMRTPEGRTLEWQGSKLAGGRLVIRNVEPTPWSPEVAGPLAYRGSHVLGNWGRRVEAYEPGDPRPRGISEPAEPGFLARARLRSLVSVPVLSAVGLRARLLLGRTRANFSKEDLDFCQTLVAQAAMVLDNVVLQENAEELAVAEERARIARDLHDGFVQSLASVDVGIEVCRKLAEKDVSRVSAELADLQRTVKQGYRDARRYLERLRARVVHGPDVDTAVRELVGQFRERGDVSVELRTSTGGIGARTGLGFELLQIVREGLTNIYRHAEATHAEISLESQNGEYLISIRDDGRGFPSAAEAGGPLPNSAAPWSIRERVQVLGGTLLIRSGVGEGSEIQITLPRRANT